MSPKPTQSSRSSLISIDPVIANQITDSNLALPSLHTRAGSSPVKTRINQTSGYMKGHGRNFSAPIKNQGKRSNSLRRAKNSTDVLRQRSTRKEKDAGHGDNTTDTKRGRTFTVTNVGTGGMLYLRPSVYQAPISPVMSSPSVAPLAASTTTILIPDEKETELFETQHVTHGQNKTSRTRSVSPKRLLQRAARAKEERAARPSHQRSQSFSTIDESRKSFISAWPKTLKIVINRAGAIMPSHDDLTSKPSLEISIPHYRLGVPRFSTHGTPILRNSSFSQTSSVPSVKRSSHVKAEGPQSAPPPASLKAFAKLQSFDPSIDVTADKSPRRQNTADSQTSSYSMGAPLAPAIYDELTAHYNDPSIVRFAHDVRDVTAASPARIIAQISSESFMDYELVSDFFLTFRSYMSTAEVLDLLLARLAWAIGRMSDDGRIIRIRTFAALRHWILNYFMDDFVTNRRIRVRFCDEVNDLYNEVRNKQIGGPSDLKILQDLKRCWNGRCSLYWDGDEFDMDDSQDAEIHPGGVIGSRNPDYVDIREVDSHSNPAPFFPFEPPPIPLTDLPSPPAAKQAQHGRQQASFASSRAADSLHSEQSIQPHSCSILRNPIRTTTQDVLNIKRPHPVTVLERRKRAPSDLQVMTNRPDSKIQHHKRGGSSFDSTRARTPREAPASETPWAEPYDGSIIRGFVFAPVEPFVQIPPTMPLSPSSAYDLKTGPPPNNLDSGHHLAAGNPAVKNIFGSIRRALSGKPGTGEMAMITISAPYSNQSLAGRKSPIPISLSRSQDELRHKAAMLPPRSPIRIDLLCAAAIESYQAHVPGVQNVATSSEPLNILKADTSLPPSAHQATTLADTAEAQRVLSHMTAESGSILIVDETGLGITTMSGALQYDRYQDDSSSLNPRSSSAGYGEERHTSYATQIAFDDDGNAEDPARTRVSPVQGKEGDSLPQKALPTVENFNSSSASTTTVKNRPSFNSSTAQLHTKGSADGNASAITAPQDYQDDNGNSQAPAQILRRMPGGDLRKNHNVHDLEAAVPHHESLDSVADTVSSPGESLLIMSNAANTQAYKLDKQQKNQVSMINTHSSQHLRPSFEAAVAGFSAIPDDDDGGLEATLLKLEGRYDKDSPNLRQHSPSPAPSQTFSGSTMPNNSQSGTDGSSAVINRGYTHQFDTIAYSSVEKDIYTHNLQPPYTQRAFAHEQPVFGLPTASIPNSEHSRDSVPLLQRSSAAMRPRDDLLPDRPIQSPTRVAFSPVLEDVAHRQELPANPASVRHGDSTRDLLRPETSHTNQSFLLDEDENLSDLSSEMSVDIINYSEAMGNLASAMLVAPGTAVSGLEIPSHPLAHSSFVNLSMHPSLALDGGPNSSNRPLTPEPSPTMQRTPFNASRNKSRKTQIPVGPAHIPFVLACDSQMLAQQLTLIEQSALTEIEWSDLVEMRWSSKPAEILDWAEYVIKQDVKGVDMVITRFNLMVKWALSEIVLTQEVTERVRVITKFIHVAAHARRLRNYATMLQITIALTSTDCTRLVNTWHLVSAPDKSLLKNMEALIQPIRNFHDLRLEMESADLTEGCIPFIGLYVHDLTYNAQKPAEIDAGNNQPPLINFERFRTAAVIVKGLLRFIDASSKYSFDPVHGMIERCLWIAALEDERIRALSKTLEAGLTTA